ncbi:sugar ABC transporter permease [Thalassococcus profundi]|jgi:capsular polysaccharide transport system permease protein|uniref:Transport permease protein n=1 Tax=Thalassococcus profundi TaxID=2282382 RepID=A0A369TGK5_9RHOB|nr:ABC transporter permease [Thalassococcus profundi]RDD64370.1 sugar ABC transporter permease [Thalassococcus profundi]
MTQIAEPVGSAQTPRKTNTLRTIVALIMREMSTTYGRSTLGYLWAILEPVCGLILLSILFTFAFRSPSIGTSYPLFLASGLLPFMMYSTISTKIAGSLRFSRQLLAYPAVTFMDALLARLILNAMTNVMIYFLVMSSIIILFRLQVILDPAAIALSLFLAIFFALGVGVMNCFLSAAFPVWNQAWSIVTRPLFFVSCVIYTFESVPQPLQDYLWYNPLVHIVGQGRSGIYATYDAQYVSVIYVCMISGTLVTTGLLLLRRYYRDLLTK